MKLVNMTRVEPEVKNGPVSINVPEQDIDILKERGWIVAKAVSESQKEETVVNSEPNKDMKVSKTKGSKLE